MFLTIGTTGNWNSILTTPSSDRLFVATFPSSTAICVEMIKDAGSPLMLQSNIG